MSYLFFSSLGMVFLLGFQQLNVQHGLHGKSFATSLFIAYAQVVFIQQVGGSDLLLAGLVAGIGGGIGASLSIVTHRHMRSRGGLFRRRDGVIGEKL